MILLRKQGERNGTSPLDSDSHMFVNIMGVGDLKKLLTKCFYVKQRDNSDNCCSRIKKKAPSLHSPQKVLLFAVV